MASILKDCDCSPIIIGGIEDHVHVLCKVSKTRSISSVVENVKKKSSKWIKTRGIEYNNFYWQNGYGAFSIGKSQVNTLKEYIQNQEEHHRKKSFKDEFLEILNRYGVMTSVIYGIKLLNRPFRAKYLNTSTYPGLSPWALISQPFGL